MHYLNPVESVVRGARGRGTGDAILFRGRWRLPPGQLVLSDHGWVVVGARSTHVMGDDRVIPHPRRYGVRPGEGAGLRSHPRWVAVLPADTETGQALFACWDVVTKGDTHRHVYRLDGIRWTWVARTDARTPGARVLLPEGAVLVAGGVDSHGQSTTYVERFDGLSAGWHPGPHLRWPVNQARVAGLPDGGCLLWEPDPDEPLEAVVQRYRPGTGLGAWGMVAAPLGDAEYAVVLVDGRVLFDNGLLWNPLRHQWTPVEPVWHGDGPLIALADGRAVKLGGLRAEVFDPETGVWEPIDSFPASKVVVGPDGSVLAMDATGWFEVLVDLEWRP